MDNTVVVFNSAGWVAKLFSEHNLKTPCQAQERPDIHSEVTAHSRDLSIDFRAMIARKGASGAGSAREFFERLHNFRSPACEWHALD